MEPHEIAESIPGQEHDRAHDAEVDDRFRKLTGIYVGVVAVLLAIATLGGTNATKEMLSASISVSDTYAYYQAKLVRQAVFETAAEQIVTTLAAQPGMPGEPKARAAALIARYRAIAVRSLSDPRSGHGQKELLVRARELERQRTRAEQRTPNFEFAEALFQIAIVLGSVSLVAASRRLLDLSGVLAAFGALFTVNGYFLLMPTLFG